MKLLLAPLQGFTDAAFRKSWQQHFEGLDAFYAPYITLQNDGSIRNSQMRDILPEKNTVLPVPQILAANVEEAVALTQRILDMGGYSDVNLNLGCPYPMATNRGKGAGLLPQPEMIDALLNALFERFHEQLQFSVKWRCGLADFNEMGEVIPVLNRYPLSHSILHPRIAKQLYKGQADRERFAQAVSSVNHPLYYNGDITTVEDYQRLQQQFPQLEGVMLGRGVLQNPLLPQELLRGAAFPWEEKIVHFKDFYDTLWAENALILSGDTHLLNKMQSYLPYFAYFDIENRKAYKKAKKAQSLRGLRDGMNELWS